MTLWIILTLMVALAVAGLAIPLVRRYEARATGRAATVAVLKDQLIDIDAQERSGAVSASEAEALRTEIKRRLLAEGREKAAEPRPFGPRSLATLALGLSAVVALAATGLYAMMGRPDLAAPAPATSPTETGGQEASADVETMVRRLEERMRATPDDPEGWRMLGWSYYQIGRYADSAKAYARAVELAPNGPGYQSAYGEALVQAAGGTVTPQAKAAFESARTLDAADARARYFLALFKDQRGDPEGALDDWIKLLSGAPADAPWAVELRRIIAETAREAGIDVSSRLPPAAVPEAPRGPTAADIAAAQQMKPSDQQVMIRGMVDGLAERLKASPRDAGGWARLMRARMVLGERDAAVSAYRDAMKIFADSPADQRTLTQMAQELGIPGA